MFSPLEGFCPYATANVGHILYYATDRGNPRLVRSTDSGKTWKDVSTPRIPFDITRQLYLPATNTIIFAAKTDGANDTCVCYTTDEGETWQYPAGMRASSCMDIVRLKDGKLMALLRQWQIRPSQEELVYSKDDGRSWQNWPSQPSLDKFTNGDIAVDSEFNILLSCSPKSWISRDQGESWEEMPSLTTTGGAGTRKLLVTGSNNYLQFGPYRLSYSSDQGEFWYTQEHLGVGPINNGLPILLPNGSIYDYSSNGLVYSKDGGGSWSYDTLGLPSYSGDPRVYPITGITCDANGTMYVSTDQGVYASNRSTSAGLIPARISKQAISCTLNTGRMTFDISSDEEGTATIRVVDLLGRVVTNTAVHLLSGQDIRIPVALGPQDSHFVVQVIQGKNSRSFNFNFIK